MHPEPHALACTSAKKDAGNKLLAQMVVSRLNRYVRRRCFGTMEAVTLSFPRTVSTEARGYAVNGFQFS